MKQEKEWSNSWKSSRNPRKQRKYLYNAPFHARNSMAGCHLSPELRNKHGRRSLPLRSGDKVKVMRGSSRNKTGKIDMVDTKKLRATIEGIEITKKDGSKVKPSFRISNLMITEPELSDKRRENKLTKKTRE
ncbi:MAG: 50S ribosomal protein L24 [Candidatus Woesearchaeota archaeon]